MTTYTFAELAPVNLYSALGYYPPTEQVPPRLQSVSDGVDSTYTTLAAEYSGGMQFSEVMTLDFVLPDPTVVPAFYYMKMRARNNTDFVANPDRFVSFTFDYSAVADLPGSPFDTWNAPSTLDPSWQFGELASASVTSPDWFNFTYVGSTTPVDTANPSADTWFEIDNGEWSGYVAHQTYAALAGDGLRFTFYPRADYSLDERTVCIDVFEVRMVVAYRVAVPPPVAAVRSTPSLRMLQRGGQGGMSGIPRMIGNPVRGLRQGPGSVY